MYDYFCCHTFLVKVNIPNVAHVWFDSKTRLFILLLHYENLEYTHVGNTNKMLNISILFKRLGEIMRAHRKAIFEIHRHRWEQ